MLIKKELLPTGPKNFDFENIPKNGHKIHNDLVNCFIKLMRQKTFTKQELLSLLGYFKKGIEFISFADNNNFKNIQNRLLNRSPNKIYKNNNYNRPEFVLIEEFILILKFYNITIFDNCFDFSNNLEFEDEPKDDKFNNLLGLFTSILEEKTYNHEDLWNLEEAFDICINSEKDTKQKLELINIKNRCIKHKPGKTDNTSKRLREYFEELQSIKKKE